VDSVVFLACAVGRAGSAEDPCGHLSPQRPGASRAHLRRLPRREGERSGFGCLQHLAPTGPKTEPCHEKLSWR